MKSPTIGASRDAFERRQEHDAADNGRHGVALGAGRRCGAATASGLVVGGPCSHDVSSLGDRRRGPGRTSTIVILALAQGSKNSDANPATQRALQIMMVAGVCVALGKLTRTDLISYHAQPGLCPSQPARAWSNAAILMVAKLEKVSDTA